jgi:uncharacterized membrane protein
MGFFGDSSGQSHGFVRSATGTITEFDPPASSSTSPLAINNAGTIVGDFVDSSGQHGFVRSSTGTITVFDAPASSGTGPIAINSAGTITGGFVDSSGQNRGFEVSP